MRITLTGVALDDPRPGRKREFRPNTGQSGGSTQARAAVIIANKLSSVGSTSVDGKGDPLFSPTLIQGGEQDVIDRFGAKSEALLLWHIFRMANPATTDVAIACVLPGTVSATADFTIAGTATTSGAVRIDSCGDSVYVGFATGDTAATLATAVRAAITAQRYWPINATGASGTVTTTASIAGSRFTHYINQIRITVVTSNSGITCTKGSVTAGSTDDDQTSAINALELTSYYYQINPKSVTSAVTSTDLGIGQHAAAMNTWVLPNGNKEQVLITGNTGSVAQDTTVAISINQWWALQAVARNNDWSPGMLAAHFGGVLSYQEAANKGANLVDYGKRDSADLFFVPPPFTTTDRFTETEIKTLLNNGCTPIQFTPTGKPFIVWHVTTKSQTNSVTDYRARPGHLPSVLFYYYAVLAGELDSTRQPNVADDPKEGERPLVGFSYPKDLKATMARCVDLLTGDGVGIAVLDPSNRDTMKNSIVVERQVSGRSGSIDLQIVRHDLKQWLVINEVSPPI